MAEDRITQMLEDVSDGNTIDNPRTSDEVMLAKLAAGEEVTESPRTRFQYWLKKLPSGGGEPTEVLCFPNTNIMLVESLNSVYVYDNGDTTYDVYFDFPEDGIICKYAILTINPEYYPNIVTYATAGSGEEVVLEPTESFDSDSALPMFIYVETVNGDIIYIDRTEYSKLYFIQESEVTGANCVMCGKNSADLYAFLERTGYDTIPNDFLTLYFYC